MYFSVLKFAFVFEKLFNLAALGLSCSTQNLHCSMWNLVPWPEIKPGPPALAASISHWTIREVHFFFIVLIFNFASEDFYLSLNLSSVCLYLMEDCYSYFKVFDNSNIRSPQACFLLAVNSLEYWSDNFGCLYVE